MIFTGKHAKISENSLEAMILRELICKYSWFWPWKVKNYIGIVGDSNSSLKLLTFQLSNVRELETIKYAFATLGMCAASWDLY